MRFFLELVFVIVVGLGLGGALSALSIQNNHGFGALNIGQWTAWPQAGSSEADPYTKAKVASDGEVPLGAAEGAAFHGRTDSDNRPLDLKCQYAIAGQTPLARFWTLTAHKLSGDIITTVSQDPSVIRSRTIIRQPNGSFKISVGPRMSGGNWLETSGIGKFELVFRLYDTQITSSSGLVDPEMPVISIIGCDS